MILILRGGRRWYIQKTLIKAIFIAENPAYYENEKYD